MELEQCVQAMRDADPLAEEAGIKTVTARDVAETLEEKSGQREREQDRAVTGTSRNFTVPNCSN